MQGLWKATTRSTVFQSRKSEEYVCGVMTAKIHPVKYSPTVSNQSRVLLTEYWLAQVLRGGKEINSLVPIMVSVFGLTTLIQLLSMNRRLDKD